MGSAFADNEKILCYHGPLLYEAKCLKSRSKAGTSDANHREYFVHYQGWNKNWDEWVDVDRILRHTPENMERKRKLMADHVSGHESRRSRAGRRGGPVVSGHATVGVSPATASISPLVTEAKDVQLESETNSYDDDDEPSLKYLSLPPSLCDLPADTADIVMPEELKYVLVSDRDLVVNRGSVFNLPAKLTISSLLDEFHCYAIGSSSASSLPNAGGTPTSKRMSGRKSTQSAKTPSCDLMTRWPFLTSASVKAVLETLKRLFNIHYTSLLYEREANQLKQLESKLHDNQPVELYGSAHLLRLMVKLPQILVESLMPVHVLMTVTTTPSCTHTRQIDMASADEDDDKSVAGSSLTLSETDDTEEDDLDGGLGGHMIPVELESVRIPGPSHSLNHMMIVIVANVLLKFLDSHRSKYFTSKNYVT